MISDLVFILGFGFIF